MTGSPFSITTTVPYHSPLAAALRGGTIEFHYCLSKGPSAVAVLGVLYLPSAFCLLAVYRPT